MVNDDVIRAGSFVDGNSDRPVLRVTASLEVETTPPAITGCSDSIWTVS